MEDNSENRLNPVFFYGLYMDPDILVSKNIEIRDAKKGYVENYQLRIGNKATLLRKKNAKAYGIMYLMTHSEINALYWGAGLNEYIAEAIPVTTENGIVSALCCNLLTPPGETESNTDYAKKLMAVMTKLDLPVLFESELMENQPASG